MPRKEVTWFAEMMETQLKSHDWKGGWATCDFGTLLLKLYEECAELLVSLKNQEVASKVIAEAADVANVAMMIADNTEALRQIDAKAT